MVEAKGNRNNTQTDSDILSLLEAEHDQIEQLFAEAESGGSEQEMQQCFEEMYRLLSLHAKGEELVFYPAMRESEETEQYIEEAEQEHNSAKILLEEMKNIGVMHPEFQTKLAYLKETMLGHIDEEESEIFEAIRQVMDDAELMDMGKEYQEVQAQATSLVEEMLAAR